MGGFEARTAHHRMPMNYRREIRTTNRLEQPLGDKRRWMIVAPSPFGGCALLNLMLASMWHRVWLRSDGSLSRTPCHLVRMRVRPSAEQEASNEHYHHAAAGRHLPNDATNSGPNLLWATQPGQLEANLPF